MYLTWLMIVLLPHWSIHVSYMAYDSITPTLEHTCILQLMIVLLPHWSIHVSYMAYDSITPTLEHTCILHSL